MSKSKQRGYSSKSTIPKALFSTYKYIVLDKIADVVDLMRTINQNVNEEKSTSIHSFNEVFKNCKNEAWNESSCLGSQHSEGRGRGIAVRF